MDDRPIHPYQFLLGYVRRYPVGHAIVLGGVLAGVACAVGSQYAVAGLVDVLAAGDPARVWSAVAVLAALVACDNLFWRVAGFRASRVFVAVTGDIRRDLFRHLVGHAPAYFISRLPGALAGRISAAADAFYIVETTLVWRALPPCFAVIGAIITLGFVHPPMAAALAVIATVLAIGLMRLAAKGRDVHQAYASEASAVNGEMVDVVNNMLLVRVFGAQRREYERFSAKVGGEVEARRRSLLFLENLRLLHAVTTAVLTAGMLVWAVVLWRQHLMTPGDVVLVVTLGFTILHGTRDLAVAAVDLVQYMARLKESVEGLMQPHEMPDRAGMELLESRPGGQISFRNVSFAYPSGSGAVLSDFNLEIAPGERVGLVGRSGAGKSTILALIQRFWDAESGAVLIDGHAVSQLTRESLAATVAVVPQEVMLFHRSVLENIRYSRPDATDEQVHAAAEAAGCGEFLAALPEGLATMVGERGVRLSGGQRQRLAIARAFLRDAPILILDEATSSLDSESEQAVQEALDRLMHGRTVIAVAHRLSTLRDFDRIVVLDAGRIVQDGPPSILEKAPGPYQHLIRRQALHLVSSEAA
ncbi:MAG TPA: ABC transporter ATP-binding protein [Acetobacteraceae bacterium]|jgi:ATP-binding cassette, subfamily B, bacterial|nr:ABC transporter ATP-binding protein [Acetobacteraceae bacterium]